MEKTEKLKVVALVLGTLVLYFIGTAWLVILSKLTVVSALSVGVFPFVIPDIIKIMIAVALGNSIKKRIGSQIDL